MKVTISKILGTDHQSGVATPAVTRIALSGTPVMNNTFDLYAQLDFLLPGIFGSREFFKREYADAIDRDQDTVKIEALRKLTAPFILRRTKSQVARDLPEKTEWYCGAKWALHRKRSTMRSGTASAPACS